MEGQNCLNCWWYLQIGGRVHICLCDKANIDYELIRLFKKTNCGICCGDWRSQDDYDHLDG